MRRIALVTSCLLVVLSATAFAKSTTYSGTTAQFRYNQHLKIDLTVKHGKVKHAKFSAYTACGNTPDYFSIGEGVSFKITQHMFSGKVKTTYLGQTIHVSILGTFSGTTVTGTLRAKAKINGTKCDSGKVAYTATKK